jgi:hypothetical protein
MLPPCQEGDLIELVEMPNDPCPIPAGTRGRVERVVSLCNDHWQVEVRWTVNRSLSLVCPPDKFRVVGSIGQILADAQAETERLKAEGWTKDDFAKALGELLEETN